MISSSSVGLTPAAGSSSRMTSGIGHQDARQFEQLALPAREHPRRLAFERRERDEIEQSTRLFDRCPLLGRDMARPQDVHPDALARLMLAAGQHVLQHGHFREGFWDLEGAPNSAGDPLIGSRLSQILAADGDGARCRFQAAGQQIEERGLAGAVRADQAEHLAWHQGDRHVVHGAQAPESLDQVARFQQRLALAVLRTGLGIDGRLHPV